MKGLILTNPFDGSVNTAKKAARMAEELAALGVQTDIAANDGFLTAVDGSGTVTSRFGEYRFVLYFDKDKYTAQMLEITGMRLFNSAESVRLCDDKMLTHIALANVGIPMPQTLSGALCYTRTAVLPDEYIDKATNILGLPLVVKECYGSYGEQVYLARTRAEVKSVADKLKCRAYLFQRFVSESAGRDMRIIVVGGKTVAAMERFSEVDFRSNAELGGKAYPANPPTEFRRIAEKSAEILGLDYCGVDVLFGKDGPLLCEVNSNAMFAAMERVTGMNVAGLYARHIVDSIG